MPKLTNQQAQALACWLIEMTDIAWERRDNFKTAAEANAEAEGLRSLCDLLTGTYLESEGNRLRAVCDNLIETNNKEHADKPQSEGKICSVFCRRDDQVNAYPFKLIPVAGPYSDIADARTTRDRLQGRFPRLVYSIHEGDEYGIGPEIADDTQGACILTAENMHTADDCTLHEHEPPE